MQPGDLIGPYRLDALIAEGGMGAVWKAHHPTLDRWVAIKVIRTEVRERAGVREAFVREVKNLSRLHSPQTLQVLDFGFADDGSPYMVTEYLHGEDLRQRLRREGALSVDDALFIGTEVLKSLSEAHALGIVHRDLKPGNVFLQQVATVDGDRFAVKVLDFGVAKFVGGDDDPDQTAWPGMSLKGSPRYMAPEQVRNERISPATDLYAFGGMMYRMLSGEPPFAGGREEVLEAHVKAQPIPLAVRCPLYEIPKSVDGVVLRCLEKRPDLRPPSAEAVRRTLEQARSSPKVTRTAHQRFADASVTMSEQAAFIPAEDSLGDLPGDTPAPLGGVFSAVSDAPPVEADPFADQGPLPGEELLAAYNYEDMPSLNTPRPVTAGAVPGAQDQGPVDPTAATQGVDSNAIGSAIEASLNARRSGAAVELELAPKRDVPRQETPLELAIEPEARAAKRVEAQAADPDAHRPPGGRDSGYGTPVDRGLAPTTRAARRAPPRPTSRARVDRTQGVVALVIVGLVLAIAWLARVSLVGALGVDPGKQLEQALVARGVQVTPVVDGPIKLTPMPKGPFEGVPYARPEDQVILDAGVEDTVQTALVIVEPGPARFVQISPRKVICESANSCPLPIDIDYQVEKAGYTTLKLDGDDLYDRRNGRWFVRLYPR